MTENGKSTLDDAIQPGMTGIGYRVILDLDGVDADLMDSVARREGLQPTQVLLEALRAYSRRSRHQSEQLLAIDRLGAVLRRAA